MNFLAHSYLSGKNEEVRVGNFIGDFVKGKAYLEYPTDIARGIKLHREIDSYTDSHPMVIVSKRRLNGKYRHYSGVIIDIFYDHFLARNWESFHRSDLLSYTQELFQALESYEEILPSRVNYMLGYMIPQNWLYHYSTLEGIDKALTGLSRRTRFESGMENAIEDLRENYDDLQNDFNEFLPDVHKFAMDQLKQL